jgi:hypothetical protein
MRRFTRLTNAFSKKLANHEAVTCMSADGTSPGCPDTYGRGRGRSHFPQATPLRMAAAKGRFLVSARPVGPQHQVLGRSVQQYPTCHLWCTPVERTFIEGASPRRDHTRLAGKPFQHRIPKGQLFCSRQALLYRNSQALKFNEYWNSLIKEQLRICTCVPA